MSKRINANSPYWYLVPAALSVGTAIAGGDASASVNVQTLSPVTSSSYMMTEDARGRYGAESGEWEGDRFYFNGRYNFIDDPLVEFDKDRTTRLGTVIDSVHTLDVGGGVFFRPGLNLGLNVPMHLVRPFGTNGRFALGDTRVYSKFRLTSHDSENHFAIMPEVSVPTGSRRYQLSNGSFGGGLLTSLERDYGRLSVALNLGYRFAPGATQDDVDFRHMMPLAIGGLYRIDDRWGINAEASGALGLPFREFNNPGDFYLGGRYVFSKGVSLSSGVAFRSIGTPNDGHFRWIMGFNMSPEPAASANRGRDTIIIRHSSTEACGIRPYTASFSARPLTAEEMLRFSGSLPYRAAKHDIRTLQIGQKTSIAEKGVPYVKDSQVVFAVDVTNLPPRQSVRKAESIALKLNVTKVSSDPYTKTELLCMLDRKICSGDVYEDPKWIADINPAFFRGQLPRNRAFSTQYLKRQLDTIGKERLYSSEVTVELDQFARGYGPQHSPMNVLYTGAPTDDLVQKKTLYFVVADDTYVGSGDAKLVLNMTEDTCTTLRLTQKSARTKRAAGKTASLPARPSRS